jgi:hypothetical protein
MSNVLKFAPNSIQIQESNLAAEKPKASKPRTEFQQEETDHLLSLLKGDLLDANQEIKHASSKQQQPASQISRDLQTSAAETPNKTKENQIQSNQIGKVPVGLPKGNIRAQGEASTSPQESIGAAKQKDGIGFGAEELKAESHQESLALKMDAIKEQPIQILVDQPLDITRQLSCGPIHLTPLDRTQKVPIERLIIQKPSFISPPIPPTRSNSLEVRTDVETEGMYVSISNSYTPPMIRTTIFDYDEEGFMDLHTDFLNELGKIFSAANLPPIPSSLLVDLHRDVYGIEPPSPWFQKWFSKSKPSKINEQLGETTIRNVCKVASVTVRDQPYYIIPVCLERCALVLREKGTYYLF